MAQPLDFINVKKIVSQNADSILTNRYHYVI